jgi:hypothetical protein
MIYARSAGRFSSTATPTERFVAKVSPEPNTGCWLWAGTSGQGGYGRFWHNGRLVQAHRFSYEMVHGPIASDLELDHLCRVHCCVNPAHLEPVTHKTNVLRGESPTASLALQTHCKNGHELNETNTYASSNRKRLCRVCHCERDRRRRLNRAIDLDALVRGDK